MKGTVRRGNRARGRTKRMDVEGREDDLCVEIGMKGREVKRGEREGE